MAEYRCPKHDMIFETLTDQRKPGALASKDGKFQAHPVNGHPDCPLCNKEAKAKKSETTTASASSGERRFTTVARG